MTREPSDIWRARAMSDNGSESEWRGRWQTRDKALAQARRWCEDMPQVWVECRDGVGLAQLQNGSGLGDPEPYDAWTNC